jgi:hypothetical protein
MEGLPDLLCAGCAVEERSKQPPHMERPPSRGKSIESLLDVLLDVSVSSLMSNPGEARAPVQAVKSRLAISI